MCSIRSVILHILQFCILVASLYISYRRLILAEFDDFSTQFIHTQCCRFLRSTFSYFKNEANMPSYSKTLLP